MKKSFLLLIMVGFWTMGQAQENHRFSLEQCLDYALQNNYDLQSYDLTKESWALTYKQSKQERWPDLSISLSESFGNNKNGTSWDGNDNISTGVTLYKGGSINHKIEQSKLQTEQVDHQVQQQVNLLTIQILQSFLLVLGNEELIQSQESVLKTSEEQLAQGEIQYKTGQILESDYLLLKSQYATDHANIVDSRTSLSNNLLTLKSLLSMNPIDNLEITHPDTTIFRQLSVLPSQEYVIERAWKTLPQLKLAEYGITIAEIDVRLSKSSLFPTLSLSAGIGTGHLIDFKNYGTQLSDRLHESVSLGLSIPIYSNGRNKTQVSQSKIRLQQAELDQKQTELDVLQSIVKDYQDVASAYNKYQALEVKEYAYRESFYAYNVKFNAGAITTVELLQQQNNYISALNEYIQGKYNFILKRKILDVYMGEPVKM